MLPREVGIGAIVVCLQLLYSQVYPHLPELQRFADHLAAFSLDFLDTWAGPPKEASVTPASHGEGLRTSASGEESWTLEEAVNNRMIPHMSSVVKAFKVNQSLEADASDRSHDLEISWDAHRITDAEFPWAYLFRVAVKNKSPRPCPLKGLARFYVLRAPDGSVFPIHRITEGPASFTLDAKQEYRYAWIFFTKYKTLEAAGGLLLENRTKKRTELDKRFLSTAMAPLEPARAMSIKSEKVDSLIKTYNWMGALDLRDVTYV